MNIFTTQGQVTPKWLIRSGRNSNLSEILCQSSLPVSLMVIEFRVTEKRWIHHFLHYKSMGKKFSTQGRITPKWIIRSGPNSNSFERFCACPRYLQVWQISYQRWLRKARDIIFFTTEGHVTPKWLVRSCRNSNPSNITCLSLLLVSLMKIEFIVTDNQRTSGPVSLTWVLRIC